MIRGLAWIPDLLLANLPNKVFASGQAIREASLTVLRPTVHGSETSRTQKHNRGLTQFWKAQSSISSKPPQGSGY